MPALQGSTWCWAHDPARAQTRDSARRKGGRNARAQQVLPLPADVKLRSIADIQVVLERAIRDLLKLRSSVPRARALAYVVNIAFTALERGDWEARLAAIEAQLRASTPLRRMGS